MQKSSRVKVPKASELVAANLRRRIVTGQLKPGEFLPNEAVLMEEFGVSRPTLREAFRILESEAIITVLRGARGGGQILEPDPSVAARYMGILLQYQGTPLSDVYRARAEIEVSAVAILGGGRRKSVLRELEQLAHQGEGLIDDENAFAEFSMTFHRSVVEGTGSPTLAALAQMLFRIIEAHNAVFIASHPRGFERKANKSAQLAYVKLVKLLIDGDTEAAQRHWRRHLQAVENFMVGDADSALVEILS
jgi:DNA-binding FadR family transcriptional regulator